LPVTTNGSGRGWKIIGVAGWLLITPEFDRWTLYQVSLRALA
jgi:hypothetical protein